MSEVPDPLEAELAALQPRGLSPDVQRRVGARLAQATRRRRLFLLAGGLAAACVVAALLAWWNQADVAPPIVDRSVPAPAPAVVPAPPVKGDDPGPTLQAYRHALEQSPEALDALLDQHAAAGPASDPQLVEVLAFTRSEATLHALVGDD